MHVLKTQLALLAALTSISVNPVLAADAVINIDASQPGPKINPAMYGIFLEEINHGVDGGLYAELIRNRGFEDAKPPEGFTLRNGRWLDERGYDAGFSRFGYVTNGLPFWSLVKEHGAEGSMHLELKNPLTPATPRSLRLEIDEAPTGGRVGIANNGFWGIGVAEGEKFNLSLWARSADGFDGPLTAVLEDADGNACTKPVMIKGVTTDWKQFKVTLTGTRGEPKAKFVLTAGSKGKVWFDMVSLFPAKTFKNHPNGLRPDLAQMLADLKPGFVRFPGGCVVEGGTIETAYNWKKTIGPLQEREEIWGPWNYRQTHGMGFYEYLQFCEDLKAEPLYVGFAGETCMFRNVEDVPMSEMGWVVTNFVDALEYADGQSSTPWGKLRAQQGHSRSFNLKIVEVGNENGTRNFPERFKMVHSALKERFPDVSYIADLSFGANFMHNQSFDIEDNHFYNSPQWFMSNTHHYDKRDRKLPPVYDGEVAVTSGEGGRDKGNMISALGEGTFLMGLERNADVVHMVSYAPLLANVRGRTDWHGMIYFDTTRCYGTASYYLWQQFGLNRPTYTLATSVDIGPAEPPSITGGIGIGTWLTGAEYKDIRVEKDGKVLYASDFSANSQGWREDGGTWSVTDGAYQQSRPVTGLSYFGDEGWTDYTLTLKARKLSGAEGFLIAFGAKGDDKYWWNIGGWGNRETGIEFNQNPVGRRVPGEIEMNRWYDIKVELKGPRVRCYLDGKLVHDETSPKMERLFSIAGRDEAKGELVLKTINASAKAITSELNISGVRSLGHEAEVTVIKSDRPSDNNSMEAPKKIVPVTSQTRIAGSKFTYEFPPYSFTLMRVKAK